MPLHLLGKKSWNVYNHTNIDRVKQDEAKAAAAEEAEEQRMQEVDSARRTAILRGERPPTLSPEATPPAPGQSGDALKTAKDGSERHVKSKDAEGKDERKRSRRMRGEDDTDRDMRLARQGMDISQSARKRLSSDHSDNKVREERPLTDARGHISLFSEPARSSDKKSHKEKEAERKKRDDEEGAGMRFADAAGYSKDCKAPWYSKNGSSQIPDSAKDAFGRPDPNRTKRDGARSAVNDPMAFMQRAQSQLKNAERDRMDWERRKRKEIEALKAEDEAERRARKRKRKQREERHERNDSPDSLEDFSLDVTGASASHSSHRDKHRSSHRHPSVHARQDHYSEARSRHRSRH